MIRKVLKIWVMISVWLVWGIELSISAENNLTLELIKEVKFEERISQVSVVSSEVEVSKLRKAYKLKEDESVFPVRAILYDDCRGAKLFAPDGKVEREIKVPRHQYLSVIDNGEKILISGWDMSLWKGFKKMGRIYELKDRKGKTIWKKKFERWMNIDIAPGARWFIGAVCTDPELGIWHKDLYFYDKNWNLVKHIKVDENHSFSSIFLSDPERFVWFGKKELVIFNPKGEILQRISGELFKGGIRRIHQLPKGEIVIHTLYDGPPGTFEDNKGYIYFLSKEWKIYATHEIVWGDIAFAHSPEGDYVGIGDYGNVYFFEAGTGKLIWKHKILDYRRGAWDKAANSISISSEGNYITGGMENYPSQ